MARLKTAVLFSGRGSNLRALIAACAAPGFPAEIILAVSNQIGAPGLDYAAQAGIPARTVPHRDFKTREEFEQALDKILRASGVELICLAGFMRVLNKGFVEAWRGKLINIHPSLLPDFPGLDTHRRALEAHKSRAGCSVHFVSPEVDAGPLIVQASVPVLPGDDEHKLAARVLIAEHQAYPLALKLIAEGHVKLAGNQALIDGKPGPLQLNPAAT
jgi:phosphoribosylglycinamide formyltransferase-1